MIVRKLIVVAFMLPVSTTAAGQEENVAAEKFFACVVLSANKYAKVKEPAGDVADAALATCIEYSAQVRRELAKPLKGTTFTVEEIDRLLDSMFARARRMAIKRVIDARNPSL